MKKGKEYLREYYKNNKEEIKKYQREYHKKYRKKNKEKVRKYQKEYQKKWAEKNKECISKIAKDYYKKNKFKVIVRDKTRRAVRNGEIQKEPCSVCGSKNSEIHHQDYNNYKDILWLCRKHHIQLHNMLGEYK